MHIDIRNNIRLEWTELGAMIYHPPIPTEPKDVSYFLSHPNFLTQDAWGRRRGVPMAGVKNC